MGAMVLGAVLVVSGFELSEFTRQQSDIARKAEACERSNCEHADIINDLKLPIQGKATK
jgi:hypothetical protein